MFARRRYLLNGLKVLDLSIMVGAFGLATVVAYHELAKTISLSQFIDSRAKVQNVIIFAGLLGVWHLSFQAFHLYESRRLSSQWGQALDVLKATSVGSFFVVLVALVFDVEIAISAFLTTFWLASAGLTVASRLALRYLLHRVRLAGRNQRNVLIVGTNARTFAFARQIDGRPELGYRIMGFVDERRDLPHNDYLARYGLVCSLAGFPAFLRTQVVDEVVVALPVKSLYAEAARIVAACVEQGIIVRYLSSIFDQGRSHSLVDQLHGERVVTVSSRAAHSFAAGVKRALDMCVSAPLLVLLAPLVGVIVLAVKLTSAGPAHFAQERLGLNKRRFKMYKFRTMVSGAEARQDELEPFNEMTGPVFKIKRDPRITRVGGILRKTSLDELPQLFNVLRGEMSLVGPRAMAVRDYEGFDADWHRRRFSVRPGITGLWQVSGRSNTSFERWMALDMEYIDNWSLSLDFRILAKTIPVVLSGSGAA